MSEYPDDKRTDEKKRFLLKVSVWSISILIAVAWLVSLRFSVSSGQIMNDEARSWQNEFSQTLSQIKGDLDNGTEEINKDVPVKEEVIAATSTADATMTPERLIGELERRLVASSTEAVATSTAVTPPKNNCPEYINCMPTIGEARPCVIPPGCENYTQIAY